MTRLIHGCEPDKVSSSVLRIAEGCIGASRGDEVFDIQQPRDVRLTDIGPWGIDRPVVRGDLFLYAIKSASSKAIMASQQKFSGDVRLPSGWSVFRKMPVGWVYDLRWDGIPNFHLAHWPSPYIRLTDSQYRAPWLALIDGDSTDWKSIDLRQWVPDNARLVEINTEVRFAFGGSRAGSAYIRTYSGQPEGLIVGAANQSAGAFSAQRLRCTSDRKIEYRITFGARLYIYVLGYCMTEPS